SNFYFLIQTAFLKQITWYAVRQRMGGKYLPHTQLINVRPVDRKPVVSGLKRDLTTDLIGNKPIDADGNLILLFFLKQTAQSSDCLQISFRIRKRRNKNDTVPCSSLRDREILYLSRLL